MFSVFVYVLNGYQLISRLLSPIFECQFCGYFIFFFFNDTAPTEIYTLSLHDALPILVKHEGVRVLCGWIGHPMLGHVTRDRKSTRLNSSHVRISYAVFCLKKKKNKKKIHYNKAHMNIYNKLNKICII